VQAARTRKLSMGAAFTCAACRDKPKPGSDLWTFWSPPSQADVTADAADSYIASIFNNSNTSTADVKMLSKALDLDLLRSAFFRHAGPDERMDKEEFFLFAKKLNIADELIDKLWCTLDLDRNGVVDAYEFVETLDAMTRARAWLRFCPTCNYDNSCAFCAACSLCPHCSFRFCPRHWREHPGNIDVPMCVDVGEPERDESDHGGGRV
jgi:hypothetical protein